MDNDKRVELYSALVMELMDGIDAGDFKDPMSIPEKYKWKHLEALFFLSDMLNGGTELFEKIHDFVIKSGELRIKEKAKNNEKIKVAFESYSSAQWPAEYVYRKLKKDSRFDVNIFVSKFISRGKEISIDNYEQTYGWFKDNGYSVLPGYDIEKDRANTWADVGGYPDILYNLSLWYMDLEEAHRFTELPLYVLPGYIDYAMLVINDEKEEYLKFAHYNKEITNLSWKVYSDIKENYDGFVKYELLKGKNVNLSGYTKMDYFYEDHTYDESEVEKLWKIPWGRKVGDMKKVIIAPHHSLSDDALLHFATFDKNLWFLYYLAKKYQNEITFVFKPHPNLKIAAVKAGLFKSYEAYDKYLKMWDELPNAKVVNEASYLEYFDTSDAMILDSCSFIVEYMYTGKPYLFLKRDRQNFTETGKKILDSQYTADGEDYINIEKFVEEIVLKGGDVKKELRQDVFAKELDYMHINGKLASDVIVEDVLKLLD
ncbi:MAG: CDP-glycerol glycerophosphotransferase family protein [Lachnospiraceae bacterium]|nr:CDP-glycerol glycerophosphotransferase family protein [Lachnospiraceae bacterium]